MPAEENNNPPKRKKRLTIFLLFATVGFTVVLIIFNIYAVYARPSCGPFPGMTVTYTHNFWYDLLNVSPVKECKEDKK